MFILRGFVPPLHQLLLILSSLSAFGWLSVSEIFCIVYQIPNTSNLKGRKISLCTISEGSVHQGSQKEIRNIVLVFSFPLSVLLRRFYPPSRQAFPPESILCGNNLTQLVGRSKSSQDDNKH